MPGLITWKDKQLNRIREEMDQFLDQTLFEFESSLLPRTGKGPDIKMSESADHLTVIVELPGLNPKDLEVTVTGTTLTIQGHTGRDPLRNEADTHLRKLSYRSFLRSVRLPFRVIREETTATYQNGLLRIVLPKSSPREKALRKKIPCSSDSV